MVENPSVRFRRRASRYLSNSALAMEQERDREHFHFSRRLVSHFFMMD